MTRCCSKWPTQTYDAKLERAIVFHIEAWDSNCPQHISPRYTVDELAGHGFARA
jgi:hypothetical protein